MLSLNGQQYKLVEVKSKWNTRLSLAVALAYVASQHYTQFNPETYKGLEQDKYWLNILGVPVITLAFYAIFLPFMKQLDSKKFQATTQSRGFSCAALRDHFVKLMFTVAGVSIAILKNIPLFESHLDNIPEEGQSLVKAIVGLVQILSVAWVAYKLAVVYTAFAIITEKNKLAVAPRPASEVAMTGASDRKEEKKQQVTEDKRSCFEQCIDDLQEGVDAVKKFGQENANTLMGLLLVTGFMLATNRSSLFEEMYIPIFLVLASAIIFIPFTYRLDRYPPKKNQPPSRCARLCTKENAFIAFNMLVAGTIAFFDTYFVARDSHSETTKGWVVVATTVWMLWSASRLAMVSNILSEEKVSGKQEPLLSSDSGQPDSRSSQLTIQIPKL